MYIDKNSWCYINGVPRQVIPKKNLHSLMFERIFNLFSIIEVFSNKKSKSKSSILSSIKYHCIKSTKATGFCSMYEGLNISMALSKSRLKPVEQYKCRPEYFSTFVYFCPIMLI